MGSQQSSAARLPPIARQHWHEVPLPSTLRRKASHGQYKLFSNALTNQKIEQYRIIFQTSEEYSEYVQSFAWRQREENIVNTRYFQNVREDTFCGSRIYAKVYLEHTPFRLNSVNDIPLGENVYVASTALAGFEKLFAIIGYFKVSEDLVGIDTEGRVKVWFNHNFSKNYQFGNSAYGRHEQNSSNDEERMVRETIAMVEKKTTYSPQTVKLQTFLQDKKIKLTFSNAKRQIANYSKRFNLTIPNYFLSLLQVLESNNNQFSDEDDNRSNSISPFIASHSIINQNIASPIQHIEPEFYSQQNVHRVVCSELELKSLTRLEQEYIDMPREGDTTGETIAKNSFRNSRTSPGKLKKTKSAMTTRQLPKIRFNYISKNSFASPLPQNTNIPIHHDIQTPQFNLPLSQIAQNTLLESVGLTRRLTYSDINEDYELDEQLAEDLVKYFNN